jgi:hypothetical protein
MARIAAVAATGALVGAAAVVAPIQRPEPASALAIPWATVGTAALKALNWAVADSNRVWGERAREQRTEAPGYNKAADVVRQMLAAAAGSGRNEANRQLDHVIDQLDDVRHELKEMRQQVSTIQTQIVNADVTVQFGACANRVSELREFTTELRLAQQNFDYILQSADAQKRGKGAALLVEQVNQFVKLVLDGATTIDNAPLARQLRKVNTVLLSSGGGQTGIIESCGSAYYAQWKERVGSATASGDQAGAWTDDRQYYSKLQELVEFWQVMQVQALYMVQQAALLQATQLYSARVEPLSGDDASWICATVLEKQEPVEALNLCTTGQQFTDRMHDDFVAQWTQTGVPYSDGDVVLALGTAITGLPATGGASIPSTLWARTPSAVPWVSSGTWDSANVSATRDGVVFRPAGSTQWNDLVTGYRRSHTAVTPAPAALRQPWLEKIQGYVFSDINVGAPTAQIGIDPYAPVDILGTMDAVRADAAPVFDTAGTDRVWLPNETATPKAYKVVLGSATISSRASVFPPTFVLTGTEKGTNGFGVRWAQTLYTDAAPVLRCSVQRVDGVLCGEEAVTGWWLARQSTSFTMDDSNWWTQKYTGRVTYDVTPSVASLGSFTLGPIVNGSCDSGGNVSELSCPFQLGRSDARQIPAWVDSLSTTAGETLRGDLTAGTLWPVAAVPDTAACGSTAATTSWGVPTRCGTALSAWISQNVPDPAKSGPRALGDTRVVAAGAGRVACEEPAWENPDGKALVYDATEWTVTGSGTTVVREVPRGQSVELATLATAVGGSPAEIRVGCSATTRYIDLANRGTAVGPAEFAVITDGAWALDDSIRKGGPGTEPDEPGATPSEESLTPETRGGVAVEGSTSLTAGTQTRVYVGAEYAGEWVSVWLFSTPTRIGGWHQVDDAGYVTVTVPDGMAAGAHRLVVLDAYGAVIGWQDVGISPGQGAGQAGPAAATIAVPLARTGSDLPVVPIVAIAGGLVAVGIVVLIVLRLRRRRDS